MKRYRHCVERIQSDAPPAFDQQFWPVLMAIVVLAGIAAGAIVTLINGPWMWGSLLILPVVAAVAIAVLYSLDDSTLRRTLQLAILVSFALHLMVLISTSLIYVFGSQEISDPVVMKRKPERTITINNRNRQLVFQQPQKHVVPDVEVEVEKKVATIKTKPQPVPVVPEKQNLKQQMTKRRQTRSTVAKLSDEQSKLSRSRSNAQPKSSRSPTITSQSQPRAVQESTVAAQPSAIEMQKSSASSVVLAAKQKSETLPKSKTLKPEPSVTRRKSESSKMAVARERPTARLRESVAKIPAVAAKTPAISQTKPSAPKSITSSESSKAEVNRKKFSSTVARKTNDSPTPKFSSSAANAQRRQTKRTNQAIKTRSSTQESKRQIVAKSPTVNNRIKATAPAASAKQLRNVPQPQSIALTRSTSGVAGTNRSKNLDRVRGGEVSPVNIASDSSSKRTSNRASDNIAMSSFQKSNLRERGQSENAKRTLRSQNVQWATKSGSQSPARLTAQSAAANIESATAQSDDSMAAEKGASMMDIGATKVVTEVATERRGGGGSPDLNFSIAQSPKAAGSRQSNSSPSVSNVQTADEIGPVNAAEALSVDSAEQQAAAQIARSGESSGSISSKESKMFESESANSGVTGAVAMSTRRRASDPSSEGEFSGGEGVARSDPGTSRIRIAQAPNVERNLSFGSEGEAHNHQSNPVQTGDNMATMEMARRPTDTLSGGSVLGTAANVMAASMSSLPLLAEGAGNGRRRERSDANINDVVDARGQRKRGASGAKPTESTNENLAVDVESKSWGELQVEDSDLGTIKRQVAIANSGPAGVELELDADLGSGGFADTVSRDIGKRNDAAIESDILSPNSEVRFRRKNSGGVPNVNPNAQLAKEAFRNRNPAALADSGPKTEAAIERGLEFLARHQLADGSWSLGQFDNQDPLFQNQLTSDTAATGLALLAFQGAGYTHREFKYTNAVSRALDWLIANQTSDGCLYLEADKNSNDACRMYSHAIAALALTEAYGMTQDPALRKPTQDALNYIFDTQDPQKGGWRYFAERQKRSTDTSVTGWMMMAIKSGKLAGLKTRQSSLDRIADWLRVAEDPQRPSQFRYNPYAVDSQGKRRAHGKKVSVTMNSVGLLMKIYSGWKPDDEKFLRGVQTLLEQLPSDASSRVRDTYYWYYASQVIKHAGGKYWDQWSEALHPLLIDSQEMSGELRGSWHPYKPVPDRWGAHGGRLYVTTMNLLSLEVKYRLLPLYESTID